MNEVKLAESIEKEGGDAETCRNGLVLRPRQKMSRDDEIALHYAHARNLARRLKLTVQDIGKLTPAFWKMHQQDFICEDLSATTILVIHYNLCMGTIIPFAHDRPELQDILNELVNIRSWGVFMLTERGHGLDARNLETTATLRSDGSFDLHTPKPEAAKAMAPTTPIGGVPKIAVVFARLVVEQEDRGIRPFVVPIHDGYQMAQGIVSVALPTRAGATPLDHALTYFNHVRLLPEALLGSLEPPSDARQHFLQQIHRVTIGGLALSMTSIPSLRQACYVMAKYSERRMVINASDGQAVPIIRFRTQLRPVLVGLAQAAVFEEYAQWTIRAFSRLKNCPEEQHGLVTAFKAVVSRDTQATLSELVDRSGWQGLFAHNALIELMLGHRANSIAEGDVLVLCIRLANELLLQRYQLPSPNYPNCPLAVHERQLFTVLQQTTRDIYSNHRGPGRPNAYDTRVLPWSKKLIQLIGQRMAYEAAIDSDHVLDELVTLYESDCLLQSQSDWYMQTSCAAQKSLWSKDTIAVSRVEPLLQDLIKSGSHSDGVRAPIVSEDQWAEFEQSLQRYSSEASRIQARL